MPVHQHIQYIEHDATLKTSKCTLRSSDTWRWRGALSRGKYGGVCGKALPFRGKSRYR